LVKFDTYEVLSGCRISAGFSSTNFSLLFL
jgi:hypothetical protein